MSANEICTRWGISPFVLAEWKQEATERIRAGHVYGGCVDLDFFLESANIFESYRRAPRIYRASDFWTVRGEKHRKLLQQTGYRNFKQHLNNSYFHRTAGTFSALVTKRLEAEPRLEERILAASHVSGAPPKWSAEQLSGYTLNTCVLFDLAVDHDRLKILDDLTEPQEGKPVTVSYRDRVFSQDLLNSAMEFYALEEGFQLTHRRDLRFAELGAGYGRLAYVVLSILIDRTPKYCIIDIPPALCISQRYLASVFPDLQVFCFRDFERFSDVEREFSESDLAFLLPHQIELLPSGAFDVFVSTATFPEMSSDRIENYFRQIHRLCAAGVFYNKQRQKKFNYYDNVETHWSDLPVSRNWEMSFSRQSLPDPGFTEALYRIATEGAPFSPVTWDAAHPRETITAGLWDHDEMTKARVKEERRERTRLAEKAREMKEKKAREMKEKKEKAREMKAREKEKEKEKAREMKAREKEKEKEKARKMKEEKARERRNQTPP
jgi:putative sugar O-methyltransferase